MAEVRQRGVVFEGPINYICELLATGKTDVMDKFSSKAGNPFSAQLKIGAKGQGGVRISRAVSPSPNSSNRTLPNFVAYATKFGS